MRPFPRADPSPPDFVPIIRAWELTKSLHKWSRGATEEELSNAERAAGRLLPPELKAVYRLSDGISLLEGNLNFVSLQPKREHPGLVNLSEQLRQSRWPIPSELVIFGDNGADEQFGIWLPAGSVIDDPHPVIEVGAIFEPKSFAIVGTSLVTFLRVWTAYYAVLCLGDTDSKAVQRALEAIGVPKTLRDMEPDDVLLQRLFSWADPSLPDHLPDPYQRGLTAGQLRANYGSNRGS